jgi:uncharacterized protein YcbK (DUF882 family)
MKKQFIYQESGLFIYAPFFYNQGLSRETKFNDYFQLSEFTKNDEFILSYQLLNFLFELRKLRQAPILISSAYRTFVKQFFLFNAKLTDTKISTHNYGLAVDINCVTVYEVKTIIKLIDIVAKKLKIKYRLGYQKYLNEGKSFVHLDIAPEFFAIDKPWHYAKHPKQWEYEIFW